MKKRKAVILISGGMDSLLITALAQEQGYDLYPIFFKYGQKTQKKELDCFYGICSHYEIPKERLKVINLSELGSFGGSSLTDESIEVEGELDKDGIPQSYVPFRNSIFLAYATSWAEVIEADRIFIGAVAEDAPGYPDCRPEYYVAYNALIDKGVEKKGLKIETPIIHWEKKKILEECFRLEAPLSLTWSCYKSNDKACGECDSCLLRKKAFAEIDRKDPILDSRS